MIRARISVENFKVTRKRIDGMGDRARRPEVALRSRAVRHEFEAAAERRYAGRLTRDTRGWVLQKRRRGLDTRSMRATGAAEAALVHGTGRLARQVEFSAARGVVSFGVHRGRSGLYYMNALSRGYKTSHGRRRPTKVVVIDRPVRENVAAIVLRFVNSGRL